MCLQFMGGLMAYRSQLEISKKNLKCNPVFQPWKKWLHIIQKIIASPMVMAPPRRAAAASQPRKLTVDPLPTMMMTQTQPSRQGLMSKKSAGADYR
uniref:Uncharacterized protein n=1 Tax=Aegilops tauschii subsp. strangulata TaxID=200361 RepID=A0A453HBN0_AEGTS